MWLFLAFLSVPLIEIALFINIGGAIGLWPTLGIVVLTAVVGTYLVRSQGLAALARIQKAFGTLNDPSEPLAHGGMILFSGALLLTPGFFTDAIGFSLMVPAVRTAVFRWVTARMKVVHTQSRQSSGYGATQAGGDLIDGEFSEVTPPPQGSGRDIRGH